MKIQEIREIAETRGIEARTQERELNKSQMISPMDTKRTNGQTYIQDMILSKSNVKENCSASIVIKY